MQWDLGLQGPGVRGVVEKPSVISQHQGLTISSELSVESLSEFLERARGLAGPPRMEESPLPRRRRLDD